MVFIPPHLFKRVINFTFFLSNFDLLNIYLIYLNKKMENKPKKNISSKNKDDHIKKLEQKILMLEALLSVNSKTQNF